MDSLFSAGVSGRILSKDLDRYVRACHEGAPPPCRLACPLDVDVAAILAKLRKGNFPGAFALYRDKAVFPAIVSRLCGHPCTAACGGVIPGGAIDLPGLERAMVAHARTAAPVKYRVPAKEQAVAIVGAGLCGLSCAVKLSSKGFPVTVFEKSAEPGGRLWGLLPPEHFLPELDGQAAASGYRLQMKTDAQDLDGLRGAYDAVLVAAGGSGAFADMLEGLDRATLESRRPGVFAAGAMLGCGPVESIGMGIRVAGSMEYYLLTGNAKAAGARPAGGLAQGSPGAPDMPGAPDAPAEGGGGPRGYSKEEAAAEAGRCLECQCRGCFAACDLMRHYNKMPRRIVDDVRVTLNAVEALQPRVATRLVGSCMDCGLCAEVCPERIDMGGFLLGARRLMQREGGFPPAFHDFWVRDLQFSQGDRAFLARNAPGRQASAYFFFPGCQLAASDPAYVEQSYAYLLGRFPETGLMLGCCGIPAEWAGDEPLRDGVLRGIENAWREMGEPTGVLACPMCLRVFRKYLPAIKTVSLYEVIAENGLPGQPLAQAPAISVFDPCASRGDALIQGSVRRIVEEAGFSIKELPFSGSGARCCGNGGHIYGTNPDLVHSVVQDRIHMGGPPYVTYCSNCRDIFAGSGKPCVHVLDIVFGLGDGSRKPPDLGERRENRARLKSALLEGVWREAQGEARQSGPELVIPPSLAGKLNRQLILEEDIRNVIMHCEETGSKFSLPGGERFIGHKRLGLVTCWVEYRQEGGAFAVLNAYSHRVSIAGE